MSDLKIVCGKVIEFEKLREPFSPTDIEWRVGQAGKGKGGKIWAQVLAYITSRAVQDRLDEVCGPANWRNEFKAGPDKGVICGISIRFNGEWITKWDGAENTDIESVKGGLSDSMKRAAVQWGIGRYLYDLGTNWAEIVEKGSHKGCIKAKKQGEQNEYFEWNPPQLPSWALPEHLRNGQEPAKEGGTNGKQQTQSAAESKNGSASAQQSGKANGRPNGKPSNGQTNDSAPANAQAPAQGKPQGSERYRLWAAKIVGAPDANQLTGMTASIGKDAKLDDAEKKLLADMAQNEARRREQAQERAGDPPFGRQDEAAQV